MEPTRAAIAAIHRQLKGDLSLLAEEADELDEESAQARLAMITAEATWTALYTLADQIDALRRPV